MPHYVWKDGVCFQCGSDYRSLICDAEPHRNKCKNCRDPYLAVENAKSLTVLTFEPHWDSGLGVFLKSRSQKNQIIKDKNLVPLQEFKSVEDVPVGDREYKFSRKDDEEFEQVWHDEVESKENSAARDAEIC